jgi:hypothetical protein
VRVAPLLGLAIFGGACACDTPPSREAELRTRLGIPPEARRVIVFGQASHLDINWQKTFSEYYRTWVENIFLSARAILDAQPRAFYSIAEMAFLRHHVEAHPEELAPLAAHARRGALRIVGGGMTSPDTLLPETELLVRDFLYGARFAEETLETRAEAAWLPDSFGHAGTLPDLLAAAGYASVGFGRIDGSLTFLEMFQGRSLRPGSTAQTLTDRQLPSEPRCPPGSRTACPSGSTSAPTGRR